MSAIKRVNRGKSHSYYLRNEDGTESKLDGVTTLINEGLVRRREIGFLKIGRAVVFPRAALDTYIAEHTVAPEPRPWGLTESALRHVRDGRTRRAS